MIPWYVYAVAAAIIASAFSITRKKALQYEHAMNFESVRTLFVAMFSLILIPFLNLKINIGMVFLVYSASLIGAIGIVFSSKAFKHGDISLLAPLANIRPAFILVLAFLLLSETPSLGQIIGIGVILVAAYLLESDHHLKGLLQPIKNIVKDKNALNYIVAIFLFSITTLLDKYIVSNMLDIYSYFFLFWVFLALNFNFIHGIIFGFKELVTCFKNVKYYLLLVAFFSFISNILALKAISLEYVSLVIPVLMLSTLFSVLIGGKFFKEENILFRFAVSILMIIGTLMVVLL